MINRQFAPRLFLLLTGFLLLSSVNFLKSQSRLELIHSDVSRGTVEDGRFLRILEGHVHARQDSLEIFCDRATYIESRRKLILQGNVRLIRGRETLTATRVTYFENRKLAIAENKVHLNRPGQELFCDYLEYYYETDQAFARDNLLLHDQEQRAYLSAYQGEYLPADNLAYVERNAHLWQIDRAGSDTLHIFAKRMEYLFGSERRAIARDSVKILQEELVATCDSAVYLIEEERILLKINPRALQENSELVGAEMELILDSLNIRKIMVRGQARAVSVLDSLTARENRLEGREIIMFIEEKKLRELWAISNASSLYYLQEENTDQGINTATADTIKVFFKEGELDSISVKGGSQGIYYPADYQGDIRVEF